MRRARSSRCAITSRCSPTITNGKPLRIAGIELVADDSEVGGGYGGYDEVHELFGYRQSI
jgi:hypothetical protein